MARVAKITVEQYKEHVAQGLKTKEIAEKTGVSEASLYTYKSQWKKAGLLDEPIQKVSAANPSELDRLTKIHADLASEHEFLKGDNEKLAATNRKLTEKVNELLKSASADNLNEKLAEKVEELTISLNNAEKANHVMQQKLNERDAQIENIQHIASNYEQHENEWISQIDQLQQQVAYLQQNNERLQHKLDNNDFQKQYNDLAMIAKPVLQGYVDKL